MPRCSQAVTVAGLAYPASSAAASGIPIPEGMAASVGSARLSIVGVIGQGPSDDEQTPLVDRHLRVVILLKSGIRRIFHDARRTSSVKLYWSPERAPGTGGVGG